MPYTVPPTFVASDPLAAADLNILGDDLVDHEGRILANTYQGVLVIRTTNQSVNDATWTEVSWASAPVEVGSWWASGTDITVAAGAIPGGSSTIACRVMFYVRFATNGTGNRSVDVYVNGSSANGFITKGASLPSDVATVVGFDVVQVADGDIITLAVYQDSGGALNVTGAHMLVERAGGL